MGVLDRLPENRAAADLREARQITRERKAMQRVGGANLRYYRIDSPGDWLWSGQLDKQSIQSATTGFANFIITLTSSTSAAFLSSLVVEVEASEDGVDWTPIRARPDLFSEDFRLQEAGVIATTPYNAKYDLFIQGPYMEYRRFKVQALSSDPVTISAERVF